MIPSRFVVIDAIPRTVNGKTDYDALPIPDVGHHPESARSLPETSTERSITQIWEDVLGVTAIEPSMNFFAIGGHSLKATQVIARIRHTLGVDLPLATLFEFPTISELAASIESMALEDNSLGVGLQDDRSGDAQRREELPDVETLSDDEVDRMLQELLEDEARSLAGNSVS